MTSNVCSCCSKTGDTVQLHDHREIQVCYDCLNWMNEQRDRQMAARGGWQVSGFEPIFTVADVAAATQHYARLGFEISHHDDAYAFAHHDRGLTIHLTLGEPGATPGGGSLYIHCEDADEVADAWRKAGLDVTGPVDEDYGKREGMHADPDGNLIRFGSPLR